MKTCKHCETEYEGTEMPDGEHDCDYQNSERFALIVKDILRVRAALKKSGFCSMTNGCHPSESKHTPQCRRFRSLLRNTDIWEQYK